MKTKPQPVTHFENVSININPTDKSVTDSITALANAAKANAEAIHAIAKIAKGPENITGMYIKNGENCTVS